MLTAAATRGLAHLTDTLHLPDVTREPIRTWSRSGVERLRLPDSTTLVYKYAAAPFTDEATTLRHLAAHRIPVPTVHAATITTGVLGMILDDLGPTTRHPTAQDAATAAAQLHTAPPLPSLRTLDEHGLRALPHRAIAHLRQLAARRQPTADLLALLTALRAAAAPRAADAHLAPFTICHSELHPTSLHISGDRWHLLDVAGAFNGPGILDLATWHGTRHPPQPARLRHLLHTYVDAGGHPDALTPRAGLPAETWALAWHRIWAAETLLHQATLTTTPATPHTLTAIRRQATGALRLFTPPP
ncbi:phosphotransferase [Micromonospora sp. WMMD1082]|uniref:phosphotransferase n=1 Tax=Micromonospora sp. WMMD1082 TaxID=3016104 RepID=UPI0024179DB0|nr:phosphotransferase [Micromonospora sp. WMMD1082]MDG4795102.1 phosphotransferase [Micromonospora sp. WMMD1082]